MSENGRKSILITGAGKGFGKLIAETLALEGHRVFATMRDVSGKNADRARNMVKWGSESDLFLDVLEMDVTSYISVDSAVKSVIGAAGGIDVVVNNAGRFTAGVMETYTVEQVQQIFDANTFGPMRVNKAVLPFMREQKSGLLIHISSTGGRLCAPFLGIYGASKFALEAIAESYRFEVRMFGVESVIVEPGVYPTHQKTMAPADMERLTSYGAVAKSADKMFTELGKMLASPDAPNPQEVAEAVKQLIDIPSGKRPLRTVVGAIAVNGIDELNQYTAQKQAEYLNAMG